jgi:hypothetical protein
MLSMPSPGKYCIGPEFGPPGVVNVSSIVGWFSELTTKLGVRELIPVEISVIADLTTRRGIHRPYKVQPRVDLRGQQLGENKRIWACEVHIQSSACRCNPNDWLTRSCSSIDIVTWV